MTPIRNTLTLLLFSIQLVAQNSSALQRSTPEAEGVLSDSIISFLNAASTSRHELHSFMMLRHGKVIAEGWWRPYRSDLKHTMYSVSKSFTASAVGFAVAEKKITVDDKVISFFPEDLPDSVSSYLAQLRIKDLLSMSVGHQTDPTGTVINNTDHWAKTFLKTPIVYEPGSKFLYNSVATYMLSAIIQKVTGERVADYLKPRLFDPLSITGIDWETDPQGINVGGWGLRLKTEDMAKFGQLFLQRGMWEGKQLLPAAWIEEATTARIEQEPDATQGRKDSSDWVQGYCYQMWRSRHNSYRADGAYGQFIIMMPDQDAVVVITSETPDMQAEFDLVWKHLFPGIKKEPVAVNREISDRLKQRIDSLSLPIVKKGPSAIEGQISGKVFSMPANDRHIETVSFQFKNGICRLNLDTDSATHELNFGAAKWEERRTTKYGPYLVSRAKHNRVGLDSFRVAGNYYWKDDKKLELTLRYIESPHSEIIRCSFDDRYVTIDFEDLFNRSAKRTVLKGVLRKSRNTSTPKHATAQL